MQVVPTGEPARYEVPLDLAKVHTAGRWNSGFIVVGVLLCIASLAGLWAMLATDFGSWFTITLVAVFSAASVGLVVTSVLRRRMLLLLVGDSSAACTITERGLTLAGAPEVEWNELVFVAVLNDRPRTNRLRSVPVYGWFGRLALKAGNGTVLCELAVRDGESLRRRCASPAAAKRITLYGRWPDGSRRGVLPLLLDAVLSEQSTQDVVRALFAAASAHDIPAILHESSLDSLRWKAPQLDPKWPAETR
ncbi:hypothetical protein [Agromyces humatus]|uniref:DUF3239 domain-containing protein n=1 Tax=Agromyces humatus TaxID=279573 RepID=A0ABP4X354_9MICO|nr:hypothetical protein [Agromyces humatus]